MWWARLLKTFLQPTHFPDRLELSWEDENLVEVTPAAGVSPTAEGSPAAEASPTADTKPKWLLGWA